CGDQRDASDRAWLPDRNSRCCSWSAAAWRRRGRDGREWNFGERCAALGRPRLHVILQADRCPRPRAVHAGVRSADSFVRYVRYTPWFDGCRETALKKARKKSENGCPDNGGELQDRSVPSRCRSADL